jgi:hypothetical protein
MRISALVPVSYFVLSSASTLEASNQYCGDTVFRTKRNGYRRVAISLLCYILPFAALRKAVNKGWGASGRA